MNAIYKFELTINGNTSRCYPLYKDSLSKDYAKESGQEFFRAKLTGELVFEGTDYAAIVAATFDTKFGLEIFISSDAGSTWSSYWKGYFYKTDCEFDTDEKTIKVKPSVEDDYTAIMAGLEHEFDLIDLAPEIREVDADKRPLIQLYSPGESVVACFLGGMWWEQQCESESDVNVLTQAGDGKPNFALTFRKYVILIDNAPSDCPKVFMTSNPIYNTTVSVTIVKDGYTLVTGHRSASYLPWGPTTLTRNSDGAQWYGGEPLSYELPVSLNLTPVSGTPASGIISIFAYQLDVLSRILCDVDEINAQPTSQIGTDDIVPDNRNYRRVKGFIIDNAIFTSESFSNTPTRWGLYEEGKYYQAPYLYGAEFYPIARSSWGGFSLWFTYATWSAIEQNFEVAARKAFTIRHAYPLASVLSVLLAKIAPNISFGESAQYSKFFYENNPIVPYNFQVMITPKSNLINSGYDTPAQKAPITIKEVFDMLRDCFRVYWYVENGKLRLEHILWFRNGGSYLTTPETGVNLTNLIQYRNGKSWAFGQNKYTFDKMDSAGRYQFGWMDDVTELFNGFPVDINSGYVDKEKTEEVTVTNYTSDIDYILLNPSEVNEDGFVLLAPILYGGRLKLPYYNYIIDGNDHYLQNAYVAFCMLINFYLYDMPAYDCTMNGEPLAVVGTKRLKTNQVKFPAPSDPNTLKLIQTSIGSGQIEKLSINLCSRIATANLKYDTE